MSMKRIILGFVIILLSSVSVFSQVGKAQAAFDEGVKLLESKQFVEAEKMFNKAIEQTDIVEVKKRAYIYKGFALSGRQKHDEAILSFTEAIMLDSSDAASYIDRALAYIYSGNHEKAIADYKQATVIDPKGEQGQAAYYYLARISITKWENEEAIGYLDKLLTLSPTDAEAYFLRAYAKGATFDMEGSITDYDMAIKYNPNYMEAYANRGIQKLNLIPVADKTGKDCIEDPCSDLLKAKEMGDETVGDMIYIYCNKCGE